MTMENVRKIVQEELAKLHMLETDEEPNLFTNHPFLGNPEKLYNYAMEWVDKAQKLGQFHQLVGNVLWNTNPPEERIEQLRLLYKEYAGLL